MKRDKTSIALVCLAAALLVLAAVVVTMVINDVVNGMPLAAEWRLNGQAAGQSYENQAKATIELTALLMGEAVIGAGMLLGFVLLRLWIREGRPAEGGNERFFA